MSALLKFFKNSGIFFLGSVLAKIVAFLMLPLYTSLIPVVDFGYYDASIVYVSLLAETVFLDIWVVLLRKMYLDVTERRNAVWSALLIFGLSTVAYGVIIAAVWFTIRPAHLLLIAFTGFAQNVSSLTKHVCRGLGRNVDFAVSGIISAVVMASMNVLLLAFLRFDYSSLYVATIFAALSEVVYLQLRLGLLGRLMGLERPRSLWATSRSLALVALPVGLNAGVYWLVNSVNRVVVSDRLGYEANGVYAIATRFGALLMLVIMAMTLAWQDLAFAKSSKDMAFFGRATSFYSAGLVTGFGALLPFVFLVFPYAVGPAYRDAFVLIPLALLVAAFSGFSNFLVNLFYALERNSVTLQALAIAAVVNVALILPMISVGGVAGALVSSVTGYTGGILFMLWTLSRQYGMRVSLRPLLPALAFAVLLVAAYYRGTTLIALMLAMAEALLVGGAAIWLLRRRSSST